MSLTTTPRLRRSPGRPANGRAQRVSGGLLDPKQLLRSTPDALRKLDPRAQLRNPVMFVVEVGSVLTTIEAIASPTMFAWVITT
jgi:potassium-transporting ATPase ATP-binding subunit